MKKFTAVLFALVMVATVACKKKEEAVQAPVAAITAADIIALAGATSAKLDAAKDAKEATAAINEYVAKVSAVDLAKTVAGDDVKKFDDAKVKLQASLLNASKKFKADKEFDAAAKAFEALSAKPADAAAKTDAKAEAKPAAKTTLKDAVKKEVKKSLK